MRGLYAHASERMRDDLKAALQARWLDSLGARAAIAPHSPVPPLDELLGPIRAQAGPQTRGRADQMRPSVTRRDPAKPGDREKMISQIPPRTAADPTPGTGMGSSQRASDLAKHQNRRVELRGFEPLTPSMRTRCATGLRYSPRTASQRSKSIRLAEQRSVADGPDGRVGVLIVELVGEPGRDVDDLCGALRLAGFPGLARAQPGRLGLRRLRLGCPFRRPPLLSFRCPPLLPFRVGHRGLA